VLPVEEVREESLVLLEQTATEKRCLYRGQGNAKADFLNDQAEHRACFDAGLGKGCYFAGY
jgi:hypothetical protein